MIQILIPDNIAEHILDFLKSNSDRQCSSGDLPESNEHLISIDIFEFALGQKEI